MKNNRMLVLESIAGILFLLLQPWGSQWLREVYLERQFLCAPGMVYVLFTTFLALVLSCLLCQQMKKAAGKKKYGLLAIISFVLVAFAVSAYDLYWNNPAYWAFWFIPISTLCKDA